MTTDQFKNIRAVLELTQADLAPLLGYKRPSKVSDLETGQRAIPWHIGQLMRCYAALGVKNIKHL